MSSMRSFSVSTQSAVEFVKITSQIQRVVTDSGMKDGICIAFIPHTTAAVTINEGADPSVVDDIQMELNKVIPFNNGYQHGEGNSAAHIKTSLVGPSQTIIVDEGKLQLGTWQSVFLCEFDGPRNRNVWVKLIGA
jgi:secondary thiamine-phosphate synthase enzyme